MARHRFTRIVLVAALSAPLAGCGGGMFGGGFDPTDIMNFLDTKKPLPGERKPVFPEGVPGVDRGVPPEMVKGSAGALAARQQAEQMSQPQLPAAQPEQPAPTQASVGPPEDEAPPPATRPPPAARPKAPAKRRSVTAPPPDPEPAPPAQQAQQPAQQASPFPSPFPQPKQSGTFTR